VKSVFSSFSSGLSMALARLSVAVRAWETVLATLREEYLPAALFSCPLMRGLLGRLGRAEFRKIRATDAEPGVCQRQRPV
jgi:hypothetical protein